METTFERGAEQPRDNGGNDAEMLRSARATRRQSAASSEWRDLVADVEDLLRKVAHVSDAEIAQVRERVQKTLARARSSASSWRQGVSSSVPLGKSRTRSMVSATPW